MATNTAWENAQKGYEEMRLNAFIQHTSKYSVVQPIGEGVAVEGGSGGDDAKQQQQVYQGGFAPKGKDRSTQKYVPKTPKGMVDINPEQCATREKVFNIIRGVFKRHGARELETPVCELKETLIGKYGEDSKLVFDLQEQGGELLSLRYDLTVPFARYVAMNGIDKIRRFHIARVYRRDRPVMDKGRFREFYQCDFDAAGDYADMVPDAECVKIVSEILDEVGLKGEYLVRVNHRGLLDGIFGLCGVPDSSFRAICSAVDKLDKETWEVVKEEMLRKGISEECAEFLKVFVSDAKNTNDLSAIEAELEKTLATKTGEEAKAYHARCLEGVAALRKLLEYASAMRVPGECVKFDMSMARGLDYYTGVIFEVILLGKNVGSIAGGGRYDNLVGMFDKKGRTVPCVGISVGIERLFAVVEEQLSKGNEAKLSETQVYASVIPAESPEEENVYLGEQGGRTNSTVGLRMRLASELWAAGFKCEFLQKPDNPKKIAQAQACEKERIPVMVYFGASELKEGNVVVRKYTYPPVGSKDKVNFIETKVKRGEEMVAKVREFLVKQ